MAISSDLSYFLLALLLAALTIGAVLLLTRYFSNTDSRSKKDKTPVENADTDSQNHPENRIWIIINPTKPQNYADFKRQVNDYYVEQTGHRPRWIETTTEDPGTGQALFALRFQPKLVLAAGGDGTVRAVAAGMAHSGVPLGILPVGTGNLLARNLHLPLALPAALEASLSDISKSIDLAWARMERIEEEPEIPAEGTLIQQSTPEQWEKRSYKPSADEFAYLVISGIGFDGETMANTNPALKRTVGWPAYVLSALGALRTERMKATVTLFSPRGTARRRGRRALRGKLEKKVNQAILESQTIGSSKSPIPATYVDGERRDATFRARTVLLANCGELPYITLAPDAVIDDGYIDVIAIDTQGGLVGWTNLAIKVIGQGMGIRPFNVPTDFGQIAFEQSPQVRIDTNHAFPVQVDGDPVGTARTLIATVDHSAVLIRVGEAVAESNAIQSTSE